MEAKVQQLLTYRPSLADLYNNRPTNSSVFLLYQYNRFSCEPIREVRRFYVHVQVGSTRISTNILYSCASALMKLSSWELKPKERILVKEHINGFAYKIKDDVFIEADRVYSLSVRRKKLKRELLFRTYKAKKAAAKKILKRCFVEEKIEEVSEELEDDDDDSI